MCTIEEMTIDNAYVKMLNVEGTYRWSTFYRSDDPENNYKWTFASSFFFAMNVYTTTGYGSISPETDAGKWFVIVYGFIFVPVTLVVIRDLGQWLLLAITKIYARILLKYRRCCGEKSDKPSEVIRLPIVISVLIMIGFIGFMTVFVYYLDEISGPPGTGLDWFHSFYFSYMSFTTIGLGDVMPNNATFAPIVSILFFLGLPIMKVVNRMTYIIMENGAFGMLTVIENRIDNYWKGKQPVIAEVPAEWVSSVTIHSIATFMKSNRDVYGGSFGKVHLRTADVLSPNEQDTVLSRRSHR
ncbi:unnamed protein product [Angiostrongylus costaricensis]|uniref:Ion channel n=1 Tax=Angiostrongylus costaricensis TaxID=334426 RepID=A0A158PKC2_ANGCS|nr:unnamed protein product [Angiostrongylus costaricensis]